MGLNDLRVLALTANTKITQIPAPVLKKAMNFHLFLSWNKVKTPELMFDLKKMLIETGKVYFPVSFNHVDKDSKLKIISQLEQCFDTRLYLTNWECLHAFKVSKIFLAPNKNFFKNNIKSIHPSFLGETGDDVSWIELDDVFLIHANHSDDGQTLQKEFNYLWSIENFANFSKEQTDDRAPVLVVDTSGLSIFGEESLGTNQAKWFKQDRKYTNEYYLRNCYLKDFVYHQAWDTFQRATQHQLNELGRIKIESSQYGINERFSTLSSCFKYFMNAVKIELEHLYLKPLINVLESTPALKEFKEQDKCKDLESIKKYNMQTSTLSELVMVLRDAKAAVFTLKRRLNKDLIDENSIMAEKVLNTHEKVLEGVYRIQILEEVAKLIEVDTWLTVLISKLDQYDQTSKNQFIFKLNVILSRLSGSGITDNLLLKLYQHNYGFMSLDRKLNALVDELKQEVSVIKNKAA